VLISEIIFMVAHYKEGIEAKIITFSIKKHLDSYQET
jgi:hypothetical protein